MAQCISKMMRPYRLVKINSNLTRSVMQFFWFIVSGGIATALHYAVLTALVELLGLMAAPAATLGALCGAAASYLLNRQVTFSGTTTSHGQALPRFITVALLSAFLNGLLVWIGLQTLGWHYMAVQALATVLVMGLTFLLYRHWTFAQ
jgi:putative flippase GtrA